MSNKAFITFCRGQIFVLYGWAILTLLVVRPLHGQDTADSREALLQKIRAELTETQAKLQTGVYCAKGKVEMTPPGEEPDGELSIFCAFDNAKRKLRFDGTHPIRLYRDKDDPSNEPDTGRVILDGGKTLFLPDQTIRWHFQPNNMVQIQPRRPVGERGPRGLPPVLDNIVKPFHINTLGLGSHSQLAVGRPFEEWVQVLERPVSEVALLEERFYRCRWEYALPTTKGGAGRQPLIMTELTFDTGSGFRPVRFAEFHGSTTEREWTSPVLKTEVRWAERAGAWVPVRVSFEDLVPRRKSVTKRTLDFEWESVNEPVDEEHFTLTGLEIPKGVLIIDERGDQPKAVRQ